jgi:hypothetical protein
MCAGDLVRKNAEPLMLFGSFLAIPSWLHVLI